MHQGGRFDQITGLYLLPSPSDAGFEIGGSWDDQSVTGSARYLDQVEPATPILLGWRRAYALLLERVERLEPTRQDKTGANSAAMMMWACELGCTPSRLETVRGGWRLKAVP